MFLRKQKSSRTPSAINTTKNSHPGLSDAIIASATEYALLTIDKEGNVVTWNIGAQLIFGYTAEEIIGKPAALLFTMDYRANAVPDGELVTARTTGRSVDLRWHSRKDGSLFWADGVMTSIKKADGEVTGFLKIRRD